MNIPFLLGIIDVTYLSLCFEIMHVMLFLQHNYHSISQQVKTRRNLDSSFCLD